MTARGRVIRIFDEEKIAVNLGTANGVVEGKKAWFFAPPTDIQDPQTEEVLGSFRYLKATGKVIAVSDKFCVVGPYSRQEESVPLGAQFGILGGWRTPTVTKSVPGHFPINDLEANPIPGGGDIGVGDTVQVSVDEDVKSRWSEEATSSGPPTQA